MRIKRVSGDSFAGLTDIDQSFEDGMNVIVGPNEAGKSTLVDLIRSLFFQRASIDRRTDKAFLDFYMPRGAAAASDSVIDGTVRFETPDGIFKLTKEWAAGSESSVSLVLPDGSRIKKPEAIESQLQSILSYGRGTYDELVFPSQRRSGNILRAIMNAEKSGAKDEVTSAMANALLEGDGADISGIKREIETTIATLNGKWDFNSDCPEGGRKRDINNPWKNGAGEIVKAYYELRRIENELQEVDALEMEVQRLSKDYSNAKSDLQAAKDTKDKFSECQADMMKRESLETELSRELVLLKEMSKAQTEWPEVASALKTAKTLERELADATLISHYNKAAEYKNDAEAHAATAENLAVTKSDLELAKKSNVQIISCKSKLAGMNVAASIPVEYCKDVVITSVATGKTVPFDNGTFEILEAVTVAIPGVFKITISPKGIDVEEVSNSLREASDALANVLELNGIKSLDELEEKARNAHDERQKAEDSWERYEESLEGEDFESIKLRAEAAASARSEAEVRESIDELCKGQPLQRFVGSNESQIEMLEEKYGSIENLASSIAQKQAVIIDKEKVLAELPEIPAEFAAVTDAKAHMETLKSTVQIKEDRESELKDKLDEKLEILDGRTVEELTQVVEDAAAKLAEKKALSARWKDIRAAFDSILNESGNNPVEEISARFNEYLGLISGGSMRLEEMSDSFDAVVSSKGKALNADNLSAGSRDTVDLAFRLAVLEALFPDGGATAFFDDPFTEMDETRKVAACELLRKFAECNQVIFTTCDESYVGMLGGRRIDFKA